MNARQFLKLYKYDERLVTGAYYPLEPLQAEAGDTIGVVLLNLGGPRALDEVEPFLYNLFMDPAIIDMPFGGVLRHWLSKLISTTRSKKVGKDYQKIGGGSPINKLTEEQAKNLESTLNQTFGKSNNVRFRVYIAMRYWKPFTEEAAQQMQKDGVNKVVLLPLYPHYSKTTTGSSLIYWWMLEKENEIPSWPTAYIPEYATHPKYVQAISERIDETLEQFSEEVRQRIQLVFSAHGTPVNEMKVRRDPYCCLIHSTVEAVMAYRQNDYPFHVSFQSKVGPAEWLTPSTPDKLKELAAAGHDAVLIIPVAFVTDHIETAFELDMLIRDQAEEYGFKHYKVSRGLNSHPLFIEALSEVVISQVSLPNGNPQMPIVKPFQEMKKCSSERKTRCHQCEYITEAVQWDSVSVENIA